MHARRLVLETLDGATQDRLPRAIFGLYDGLDTDILFLGSGLNSFPAEAVGGVLRFAGRGAPLLARPLIGSAADLRRIEDLDLLRSPHAAALARVIEGVRGNHPDRFLCATSWGPFTWAMVLCDHELLREKLRTDRAFVKAAAELGVRLSAAWFDLLVERHLIDGVCIPDGAATLLPAEDYRDLVLPRQRELFDRARAGGCGPSSTCAARRGSSSPSTPAPAPTASPSTNTSRWAKRTISTGKRP